jgi:glycerophosphoryl diester phosphodiesterase
MKLFVILVTLLSRLALADSTPPKPRTIDVQAHRGARSYRPENTIPAFQYGLQSGATTLEFDVLATKDGHLVITHDPYINPEICQMEDGTPITEKLAIYAMTLEQIKKIDCGTLKNPRFPKQVPVPGAKIPTMDEFFEWLAQEKDPRAKTIRFNVEAKSEEATPELGPDPETFAKMILDKLKKHGVLSRCTFQSFDFRVLKAARKLDSTVTLAALVEDRPNERLSVLVKDLGVQIVSPNCDWLTGDEVKDLQKAGLRVVPWTANTVSEWAKLVAFGVEGIISDDPTNLLSYLKKKGIQGTPCDDAIWIRKP